MEFIKEDDMNDQWFVGGVNVNNTVVGSTGPWPFNFNTCCMSSCRNGWSDMPEVKKTDLNKLGKYLNTLFNVEMLLSYSDLALR